MGLVGCVKTKVSHPAPAGELYASTLYRGRRSYVEATCDRWFILSAKHGVVEPNNVIEPYEETLTGRAATEKRAWARRVLTQLEGLVDVEGTTFEVHAGREHRDFGLAEGLRRRGATVEVPAEHLGQGEQLAFYNRRPGSTSSSSAVAAAPVPLTTRPRGSYVPLGEYLDGLHDQAVQLSFVNIEEVLGRVLPMSARRYRAWWANEAKGTHSQAAAWMDVGWLVDGEDFGRGMVRFRKV